MYNWKIHGLWPDYKNTSYPSFCCDSYKFDIDELNSISNKLKAHWQDFETDDVKNGLWFHEWNKHGTCTVGNSRLGTIFNYFNTTLALFEKYKVQRWLEEDNIRPRSTRPHDLTNILNSIQSRLGDKRINVVCDKYVHTKENCDKADYSEGRPKNCTQVASKIYKLLDSIDICFDKYTLEPIDCTQVASKIYKLLDSIDICFDKYTLEPIDCPMEPSKLRKNICDKEVYYFRSKKDLNSLKL